MMTDLSISALVHRRFILGKQGIWPGRRWRGLEGTATALKECEALQLDPLNIVARSQDIALHSRILEYRLTYLNEVCYAQRRFFDYGGALFVYPMDELPYWRLAMRRDEAYPRWIHFQQDHPETVAAVREALQANGPLGNRDFKGNHKVNSYRGSKDTSLALYYLWLTGEVMVHHRENFQRVYDLRSRVAPPELDYAAAEAESEAFFANKALAFLGLTRLAGWASSLSYYINRKVEKSEALRWMAQWIDQGTACPVSVEGEKDTYYALSRDVPLLETLQAGQIPPAWQPLETTTEEEVAFLAPLEICTARRRAQKLFGFDYVWEVYKPLEQRRWGYYVLPILWGDRLVGRLDPRLERNIHTLHILGFWLEDRTLADDPAFGRALGCGLRRFRQFLGDPQLALPDSFPNPLLRWIKETR
jgi:hypothetical protein